MSRSELPEHHYEFPRIIPLRLPDMRGWLRACLHGQRRAVVQDAALLLTELATNAYEHGGGLLSLRLSFPTRRLMRIEVDDPSTARLPERQKATPTSLHGRGLLLVDAISSTWGVRNQAGHKTVWAELALG